MSEEELNAHIVNEHPEKTASAEAFGQAMEKALSGVVILYATAANLTFTVIGNKGASVYRVWDTFTEILNKLVKFQSED